MRWNRIEKPSDGVEWRCFAKERNCYELRSKGKEQQRLAGERL